jgi:hypothetical protein
MPRVPAYCLKCEFAFKSDAISISNATNITLTGNTVNCPKCGGTANIVDGNFNENGSGLEIISAPQVTYDVFAALSLIAQRLSNGEIKEDEAVAEAKALSPSFSKLFDRYFDKGISILVLIIAIITVMQSCTNSSSDADFQLQVLQKMDHQITILQQFDKQKLKNLVYDNLQTGSTNEANAKRSPTRTTEKSHRRSDIIKERKRLLLERRMQFNPR